MIATRVIFLLRPETNYGIATPHIQLKFYHWRYSMKKIFLSLVSWALISSLPGVAPVTAAPRQGTGEVQVSGGLFHAEDSDIGNLNLDLSYGWYLSPGWQVGFRQALNYNFIEDATDQWIASTAPLLITIFELPISSFPTSARSSAQRGTITDIENMVAIIGFVIDPLETIPKPLIAIAEI